MIRKKLPIVMLLMLSISCQSIYKEDEMRKVNISLPNLISQLESNDRTKANEAYEKIYASGKLAIPYLLNNWENEKLFYGTCVLNPLSSQLQSQEDITVGIVSLYLIEAIIRGDKLHSLNPLLLYREEKGEWHNSLEKQKKAAEIYRKWLEKNKDKSLEVIRYEKHSPLLEADICWYGLKGLERGSYDGK